MTYKMLFGFVTTVRSIEPNRNLKKDATVKTSYIVWWSS